MNQPVHRHPSLYKRAFASIMARSSATYDGLVADRKQTLLSGLHGNILEIGAGTAPNLAYYAPDVRWVGVDPNPAMFIYAQREADRLGKQITLREGQAENLPAADSSMDAVISTLVLCSVHDPRKALQEIFRVLKPGGRFIFIEHVAAPRQTRLRRLQRIIRPLWKISADGCYLDRETWAVIEHAGFSHVTLDHFKIDAPLIGPHIAGFAVK